MSGIKRILKWFLMLNKRLFKKPGFLVILLLIPILVLSMNVVAENEDSSIMTVVLVQQDKSDPISTKIVNELLSEKSLIKFTLAETEAQGEELVKSGEASAAWIFPKDIQKKIDKFVKKPNEDNYVIRVIEQESSVFLMLTHEKLVGAVYENCSRSLYVNFIRENISQLDSLTDEELLAYYDGIAPEGEHLFKANYVDTDRIASEDMETSYLVTPMRGLLAALIVLCGLAAAMFYIKDDKIGTFSLVSQRIKPFVAFGYHTVPILLAAFFVLIALILTDSSTGIWYEILSMVLYVLCTTVFCMIIRLLCKDIKAVGVLTPVLIIIILAICPVFFDIFAVRPVQVLLPTFNYISAIYDPDYLLYMVIYFAGGSIIYFALSKLLKRV